jgi:hypothetical protein
MHWPARQPAHEVGFRTHASSSDLSIQLTTCGKRVQPIAREPRGICILGNGQIPTYEAAVWSPLRSLLVPASTHLGEQRRSGFTAPIALSPTIIPDCPINQRPFYLIGFTVNLNSAHLHLTGVRQEEARPWPVVYPK